jgi:streptogramin lyase
MKKSNIVIISIIVVAALSILSFYSLNESSSPEGIINTTPIESEPLVTSKPIAVTQALESGVKSNVVANYTKVIVDPELIKTSRVLSKMASFSTVTISADSSNSTVDHVDNEKILEVWTLDVRNTTNISIQADNNGNIWYTEDGDHRIGRLIPSTNEITEWSVSPASFPRGIITDSDGKVWFTEVGANKIGLLDPSKNEITEWLLPIYNTHPIDVVVDSDGNVFFTEDNGNKISRLDPSTNEITMWEVPSKNPHPFFKCGS